MFWWKFHTRITTIAKKNPEFRSVIFIIFLHTFKVSSLSVQAATCKKPIGGPKFESKLVKNSPIFLKVHFSKFTLCSTDFDRFCRISTYILQTSYSQISAKLMQAVLRYEFFSSSYPPKTLNAIFSKVHFSNFAFYLLVFQVQSSNMPCILRENVDMCAHYLILWKTQNSFFQHS